MTTSAQNRGAKWLPLLLAVLLFLISAGCSFQSLSQGQLEQELFKSIDADDLASVERLLNQGANLESRAAGGETPLIRASENGNSDIVKLLLQRGANIGAEDQNGVTALIGAAESLRFGNAEVIKILLPRTTDPKLKVRALLAASRAGVVAIVASDGPSVPAPTVQPEMPEVTTVRALLDAGVPVDARDEDDNSTPLIEAASHGQLELVQLLLSRGATVDAVDKYGNTALIGAACECAQATMRSTFPIVELLLAKGANVNARSVDGTTPLMSAASGFAAKAIVPLLLKHHADPSAKNGEGKTALTLALESDQPEVAELIRKASGKRELSRPH